ncbi:FYVE zinc finger-domain containing protein [Rhodotorula toruloides]|uniref:FYVE zinc finger-domain containing protein n=1 Tax=Rhodotorula toruloides TaxID=5286 RepID=A0A2T0A781_RHOTO|nr:FYVE zinc finger-domain containing protein [Rhodotorula toruloides]
MSSPSYVPYTPKRHSTNNSITSIHQLSSSSTPPHHGPSPLGGPASSSRTSSGLVRPSAANADSSSSLLKAPQPSRPALPAQFSGLSTVSVASSGSGEGSGGSSGASRGQSQMGRQAYDVRQARSPPPAPSNRPTPPPSTFPFASVPPGQSPFPPGTPDRSRSPEKPSGSPAPYANSTTRQPQRGKMPYQAGFQPHGVRRDRSDEFFGQRKRCSEARKLDEGRLERRLEKLVALHFPSAGTEIKELSPKDSTLTTITSLRDTLRNRTAKELWRSVAGNVDVDIERAAEQAIVKWQDDKDAIRCPICTAAFGVRTRRHHCRLCGRVVCFLPPTPISQLPEPALLDSSPDKPPPPPKPVRRERCSTFFTYEHQQLGDGSRGEKKPYGVVVEVPPVEQDLSLDAAIGAGAAVQQKKEEDRRKKVRVCRDCLNTALRLQMKALPIRTPTWLKLYEVLVQLEQEINVTLPSFQELVVLLSNPSAASQSTHPPSANHAKTLRKRLLTDLASYDTVSKRIRDLPLPPDAVQGGSQDRLQRALANRGAAYLSEKLGLLRSLGNVEELGGGGAKGKGKKKDGKGDGEYTVKSLASLLEKEGVERVNEKVGPELEAMAKLNVLREQEALVRSYVDDANARRQFEDAAALQASLEELRAEIPAVSATLP